ncbi:M48 family metalloprotease [Polaromonas sp.]|uniref:M48 family metalloprotease n=1 Tax=Polaromonas sp. TaxID=1869339 RepID=UPI0039C9E153
MFIASAGLSQAQSPGRPSGALPTLGDTSELTAGAERRLGDRIASSIYRDPDYLDDPVLGDYLQGIWKPLMVAARARGELSAELEERFAWDLMLIRNRSVNAFALPGGYLGVHLGLISVVSTRDELASVLAHELSHVTQRHISRLMSKQDQQVPLLIATILFGIMAAGRNADMANAAIAGGQALAIQNQLNFSRDMEREADRVGFGVMAEAGFDKQGFTSMFEKLEQASRLTDSGSFPYLRTHPLNTERIAEAKSRLQLEANTPAPSGAAATDAAAASLLHAMMAGRARVMGDTSSDALQTAVTNAQRAASPATAVTARDAGALYAGTLAAIRLRDYVLGRSFVARLRQAVASSRPLTDQVQWLAMELELAAENPLAAIKLTNTSSRPAVLLQARADIGAGRAAEASGRLQRWVTDYPKDAIAWELLSQAYGKQGQLLRAIRADAEARVAQLDYPAARDRLKAAQDMVRSNRNSSAPENYIDSSIIDTRAREVDQILREQAADEKAAR